MRDIERHDKDIKKRGKKRREILRRYDIEDIKKRGKRGRNERY